jgi:cytochrome oxidase assembly protein ShyY1
VPAADALPASHALAPRYWGAHLLMVLAVVVCALLGYWQLGVWQSHRADDAARVTDRTAVPLDDVMGPDAAFPASGLGRPVKVVGRWDPAHTVYVADRVRDGRTGVWAVTPVVTHSGSAMLVVRGWAPDPKAVPAPPTGQASLVGLLQPSEDTGAPAPGQHDDVIPELNVTDLLPRASYDLYGGYVLATDRVVTPGLNVSPTDNGMSGLEPASAEHLPGADATSGLRNLLYAFQWWVFGAFAVFMWWRWLEEDVLGRRPSPRAR